MLSDPQRQPQTITLMCVVCRYPLKLTTSWHTTFSAEMHGMASWKLKDEETIGVEVWLNWSYNRESVAKLVIQ